MGARVRKVSVTLHGLTTIKNLNVQGDLFDIAAPAEKRKKENKLSHVMDALNRKFGRDTVLLGLTPAQGKTFSGTQIAFTRIPDAEEFMQ